MLSARVLLGRQVRPRPALVLLAVTAMCATLLAQPGRPASADPGPAAPPASTPPAARALAAAEALLIPGASGPARRSAARDAGRDATLVLRELRLQRDGLDAADRASADRMLVRPTSNRSRCNPVVCVHWRDGEATSGYVDQVAAVTKHVVNAYRAAGYRAPRGDGARGGDARLDVYLDDLGADGLYGYCDTDVRPVGPYDTWAYCTLDDDYREFPFHTPIQNLKVTAAHELFHAVQFAYDYYEDAWFMEATATWAEDELYDDVDDNVQYLAQSPLAQPGRSLDRFVGMRHYGDWILFRYLTERHRAAAGGLPTLVRDLWRRADAAAGGRDDYSVQAISHVLRARGSGLRTTFARFADANRRPARSYAEGRANRYPTAPLAGQVRLTRAHRDSGWVKRRVDHLASATIGFPRDRRLTASGLRVWVDLPPTARGSGVVVTAYRASGRPIVRVPRLSADGDATTRIGFGGRVERVEVTLANAGIRYRCGTGGSGFSCNGRSLDDGRVLKVRVRAVR